MRTYFLFLSCGSVISCLEFEGRNFCVQRIGLPSGKVFKYLQKYYKPTYIQWLSNTSYQRREVFKLIQLSLDQLIFCRFFYLSYILTLFPTCGSGTKLTLPCVHTVPIANKISLDWLLCLARCIRVVNLQKRQVESWSCQTGPAPCESLDWFF